MFFNKFTGMLHKGGEPVKTLSQSEVNLIYKHLDQTRIFLFEHRELSESEKEIDDLETPEQVDLPFKTCWFEMNDEYFITEEHPNDPIKVRIAGLYIIETEPRFYIVFGLMKTFVFGNWRWDIVNFTANNRDPEGLLITQLLLDRLKREKAVSVESKTEVKFKRKLDNNRNEKVKVKLKPIIYISNNQQFFANLEATGHRKISQVFDVRGHWRKLENPESIGKDRDGIRNVKGSTWVSPYIKGDVNSELTPKVRIVK